MKQAPKITPIKGFQLYSVKTADTDEHWFVQNDCFPSDYCARDIHTGAPLALVYKEL